MIDLFILHFKDTFLRLVVNLITKCFISGHVKFGFIDRHLLITLAFGRDVLAFVMIHPSLIGVLAYCIAWDSSSERRTG